MSHKSPSDQAERLCRQGSCGVNMNADATHWFREHSIAAVAGDMLDLERFVRPEVVQAQRDQDNGMVLSEHQNSLPTPIMPVGELWDLGDLSTKCASLGRYTFLLTCSASSLADSRYSLSNGLAMF